MEYIFVFSCCVLAAFAGYVVGERRGWNAAMDEAYDIAEEVYNYERHTR